jgi:hypothetical protein
VLVLEQPPAEGKIGFLIGSKSHVLVPDRQRLLKHIFQKIEGGTGKGLLDVLG